MVLRVNGVDLPTPKKNGYTVTRNKIWSRNAGRSDDTKMVGTILGIKYKIQIEWPPLSPSQTALVDSVVSNINNPYQEVTFTDLDGSTITKTMYWGDGTYPVYTMNANGQMILSGVKADAIEQ